MTHFFPRSALVLLAASALSACASDLRPNFPIVASSTAPPPPAVAPPPPVVTAPPVAPVEPPPYVAPAPSAVESRVLEPLTPAPPRPEPALAPVPAYIPPPVAAPRASPPPPPPAMQTVTRRSVTGRVVEVDGKPSVYEVKSGDNLARIAARFDTTVEQLAKDNGLKSPYRLQPGDKIERPGKPAKAYVVGSQDTLSAIGRRFSVSVEALRAENDLSRNATLRSGQRVRLPSGYRDRGPIVTTTQVETNEAPLAPPPTTSARRPSPPAEPAYEPEPRPVTSERTVTGRVITVPGRATSYKVQKGDSLTRVADKLDTTVEQLSKDNRLKAPYRLQPGQTLKGPLGASSKAYVANGPDTLAGVAERFSVSVETLRRENGLSRRATIRDGQRLKLPKGFRDKGPVAIAVRQPAYEPPAPVQRPATRPAPAPAPSTPSSPRPYAPSTMPPRPPAVPPAAPVSAPPLADAQISQLGRGRFIWPLRGDILSDFGPLATGQRNDGVNIRAAAGDPVRASASGDVVYAGDQVPGFGNLVLIKHAAGWVTAYGHLGRVDVKMQDRVSQGQQIGQAGSSGGVAEPQLHFEVRYAPSPLERARPIQPGLVLPR